MGSVAPSPPGALVPTALSSHSIWTENPTFTFELGKRYRIENNGGRSAHPFAVENGNEEYLLRQEGDKDGSLEGNADINYVEDDNGVTFTYTQTLADAVAAYQCTFHSSMEGSVETSSNDGGGGY